MVELFMPNLVGKIFRSSGKIVPCEMMSRKLPVEIEHKCSTLFQQTPTFGPHFEPF
jgi:hypothetical protein